MFWGHMGRYLGRERADAGTWQGGAANRVSVGYSGADQRPTPCPQGSWLRPHSLIACLREAVPGEALSLEAHTDL